ncbi:hypothetical protein HII36_19655 [Nonomuraea sp. NN258]|uniref:hypothetical protein n=1 Tax=Nonomuraea antri TaxID=2730852 RepID=UPI001567DE4C|nr:hypothetical protein [Nonomuraea antri]NRQ34051.1 hypothetical protein [Nonomuraea antri]
MMKEFQLIDDVMPDVPPAGHATMAAARARALGSPSRRSRLPRGRLLLAAAAVVLVAAGGLIALPRLGGETDTTVMTEPGPAALLETVADRLAARPPATGAWWRRETLEVYRSRPDGAGYTVEQRAREVVWRDGRGRERRERTTLSVRPLTPADEQAWRAAGAPSLCRADQDCRLGKTRVLPLTQGAGYPVGPIAQLPTEPTALKAALLKVYPEGAPESQDSFMWNLYKWLLLDTDITPGTRGAVYRLMAAIPGTQVADGVATVEGRVGLALLEPREPVRQQIIIDRDSGDLLAVQDVLVKPDPRMKEVDVGQVYQSYLVTRAEWTAEGPKD